uniref:Ubiquitin-like domain-containing protein n=1 Tax=Oryza glumipatula TaxID=40148 RepID=A0A0E0B8Q1_9ORYZ
MGARVDEAMGLSGVCGRTRRKPVNIPDHCLRIVYLLYAKGKMAWRMKLQHLKDITDQFSPGRELGKGGFGVVYKGILANGKPIAVKRLQVMPGIQDRQFNNEVHHLMGLKHQNIVQLIGYCDERQEKVIYDEYQKKNICAEVQERLLCYEYMVNGSLDKGYMAPEYCHKGEISTKSDIYSLGILILEIVTGEKNHQSSVDLSGQRFIHSVRNKWSRMSKITSRYPLLDTHSLQQVHSCFKIGLTCVEIDPKRRPPARKIVNMLPWECKKAEAMASMLLPNVSNGRFTSSVVDKESNVTGLPAHQVDSNMKEILSVNPLELWFPMKAQEEFSCSMLLKNKTHHYVAYKINAQKLNIYRTEPCSGLISPQFTCNISVRMQAQQGVSPNMQLMDRILVQSVVVSDDQIDIAKDLSCKQKGKLVLKGPDKIMSKIYVNIRKTEALDENKPICGTTEGIGNSHHDNKLSGLSIMKNSSCDDYAINGMRIYVKIPSIAKTIKLIVKNSNSVADVKVEIERKEGILLDNQMLMYAGRQLDDRQILSHFGLSDDQILHVLICLFEKLRIFVNISNRRTVRLDVESWYTVADVKLMIEALLGFPACTQLLMWTNPSVDIELMDTETLKDQNVKNNTVLLLHPNVQIFIKSWEGRTLTTLVSMFDTAEEIWKKIKNRSQIKAEKYYLCYRGHVLPPGVSPDMYKIESNSTISIRLRNSYRKEEPGRITRGTSSFTLQSSLMEWYQERKYARQAEATAEDTILHA